jgi:hypothetical protein
MSETPSPSSPRSSNVPSGLSKERELFRVVELFQQRALWSALETVLRAEREVHLRALVYSPSRDDALEHRGVVKWLDSVLEGALESYQSQAETRLGLHEPTTELPGSPWMADDGLNEEDNP